jgi:hypothetical protein
LEEKRTVIIIIFFKKGIVMNLVGNGPWLEDGRLGRTENA